MSESRRCHHTINLIACGSGWWLRQKYGHLRFESTAKSHTCLTVSLNSTGNEVVDKNSQEVGCISFWSLPFVLTNLVADKFIGRLFYNFKFWKTVATKKPVIFSLFCSDAGFFFTLPPHRQRPHLSTPSSAPAPSQLPAPLTGRVRVGLGTAMGAERLCGHQKNDLSVFCILNKQTSPISFSLISFFYISFLSKAHPLRFCISITHEFFST